MRCEMGRIVLAPGIKHRRDLGWELCEVASETKLPSKPTGNKSREGKRGEAIEGETRGVGLGIRKSPSAVLSKSVLK